MDSKSSQIILPDRTLLWLFFSFRGRIRRKTFAIAAGFLLLPQIYIIIQMIKNEGNTGELTFWLIMLLVTTAVSLWSLFSLFVKRLHDLDLPGPIAICALLSGINVIFFLFLVLMPSKQVTNDHGPPIEN